MIIILNRIKLHAQVLVFLTTSVMFGQQVYFYSYLWKVKIKKKILYDQHALRRSLGGGIFILYMPQKIKNKMDGSLQLLLLMRIS